MLKRKCGLRDKHIDDVRLFENYSLVSVPFSEAESVVSRLNASGGRRRIARIDREDAAAGAKPEPGESRPEAEPPPGCGACAAGRNGAAGRRRRLRRRRAVRREPSGEKPPGGGASEGEPPGERGPERAANDWNVSPAGGNEAFDWEAFQRFAEAAAWRSPGAVEPEACAAGRVPSRRGVRLRPKRLAAKDRKR